MTDTTAATERLLPCPFCGGEARVIEGDECAVVQCLEVKMHRAIPFSGDNTAAEQVAAEWNKRSDSSSKAEVERLRVAMIVTDTLICRFLNDDKRPEEFLYDLARANRAALNKGA